MPTIRSLQLAQQRPDTAEDIRYRLLSKRAHEAAHADMRAAFPVLTADNAGLALAYQEKRIVFYIVNGV